MDSRLRGKDEFHGGKTTWIGTRYVTALPP